MPRPVDRDRWPPVPLTAGLGAWLPAAGPAAQSHSAALRPARRRAAQGGTEPSRSAVADAAMRRDAAAVRTLVRAGRRRQRRAGRRHDGAALGGHARRRRTGRRAALCRRQRAGDQPAGPLHAAPRRQPGRLAAVVKALLASGADVNAATGTGATALMLAAQSGNVAAVAALARREGRRQRRGGGARPDGADVRRRLDRAEVVRLLLARGATAGSTSKVVDLAALTDAGDGEGRPPEPQGAPAAHRAAGRGRRRDGRRRPASPARRGRSATTSSSARRAACRRCTSPRGRAPRPRSQALVEAGADVNLRSPGDRTTPLLIADAQRPLRPGPVPARARRRSEPGQPGRAPRRSTPC